MNIYFLFSFLITLIFLLDQKNVHSLVIGIDFGSESFKIALVKPGSIDIVLNEESSRKTPSMVAFSPHGRLFGEQAYQFV